MTPFLRLDRGALASVGSFWSATLRRDERPKARMLVERGSMARYAEPLQFAKASLAGEDAMDDFNVTLRFRPEEVITLGTPPLVFAGAPPVPSSAVADAPGTTQTLLDTGMTAEGGRPVWNPVVGSAAALDLPPGVVVYALRLPPEIAPVRVTGERGDMFVNEDFLVRNSHIIFFRNPLTLFPNGLISVGAARRAVASIISPVLGVDRLYGSVLPIVDYYRNNHSLQAWLAAGACAAGLGVFTEAGFIVSVTDLEDGGKAYVTDKELVTADYPHTALQVGAAVTAGQVVGDVLRLVTPEVGNDAWWQEQFPDGLPLDGLAPYSGMAAPTGACAVTFHGFSPTGRPHVRLALTGADGDLAAFWATIATLEEATGRYVFDATGLPEPAPETTEGAVLGSVQGARFYLDNLLTGRLVVIALRVSDLGRYRENRITRFMLEQRPAGVIPLFLFL